VARRGTPTSTSSNQQQQRRCEKPGANPSGFFFALFTISYNIINTARHPGSSLGHLGLSLHCLWSFFGLSLVFLWTFVGLYLVHVCLVLVLPILSQIRDEFETKLAATISFRQGAKMMAKTK
jgi:hypothetical protein